jgi:hypothetical protein
MIKVGYYKRIGFEFFFIINPSMHSSIVRILGTQGTSVEVNTSVQQFLLILIPPPPPPTALSMKSCGVVKHTFNQAADLAK